MQHEEINEHTPLRNGSLASDLPAACRSQEGTEESPPCTFTVRLVNGFRPPELENPPLPPLQILPWRIKIT